MPPETNLVVWIIVEITNSQKNISRKQNFLLEIMYHFASNIFKTLNKNKKNKKKPFLSESNGHVSMYLQRYVHCQIQHIPLHNDEYS